jgi:hypothetical protein
VSRDAVGSDGYGIVSKGDELGDGIIRQEQYSSEGG